MKILLIGSTGQLGSELLRQNPGHQIYAPGRNTVDLAQPDSVTTVIQQFQPNLLINCAAFHDLPKCEKEPEKAFFINCVAIQRIAAVCAAEKVRFVTFSTDYVFGGQRVTPWREDDLPSPLQTYGITRLAGEYAAMYSAPDHAVVIRTCGLYGLTGVYSNGGNFVDKRVAESIKGVSIEISSDQQVIPTSAANLATAVYQLVDHEPFQSGIYHLVNEGACTWYEFTCEIVRLLGSPVDVIPVDRRGRSGSMRRPLYSVLGNTRARAMGIVLRPWQDALAAYLKAKYHA